jgi:hypothetical protein
MLSGTIGISKSEPTKTVFYDATTKEKKKSKYLLTF